jgi:tRNA-specific 2-thiouridylase
MEKVVVAMSGGVDSSVAALLLHEQGYEAIGISMQVWDYRNHGGSLSKATCCAPSDFTDARQVAQLVGIPYYVFDFEEVFREKVIDNFVNSYRMGLTPNPCVECNRKVKFAELRDRAASIGAAKVATGHYAQIEQRDDGFHLLRGSDDSKDQSYFLWAMTQDELSKTLFPVGSMTKSEVRERAKQFGLVTAEKPESQDVCFVSGKLKNFLNRMGVQSKEGNVVNTVGETVGSHDGVHSFTVGQRRGVNVGGQEAPLYVVDLRPESGEVVVGHKSELEKQHFFVGDISFCSPESLDWWNSSENEFECLAQLRYRHRGVAVKVKKYRNILQVFFNDEWSAVSPGQFSVFYDKNNTEVLGGGRILHEREVIAMEDNASLSREEMQLL